jgi:exosome complex component RRP41
MMPFSGAGERVKPGPSRRSKEISYVTENALLPVVNLTDFPNAVVDVYIELSQTDAGSRCAGICAASMALADAGIIMKDLVAAVAVGVVDGQIVLDLDYDEEAYDKLPGKEKVDIADIPLAVIPSTGQFTLLQMDGKISVNDLMKAFELGKQAIPMLIEIQRNALKSRFEVDKND